MAATGNRRTEFETLNTAAVRLVVKALSVLGEQPEAVTLAGINQPEAEAIRIQLMDKLIHSTNVSIRYNVENRRNAG